LIQHNPYKNQASFAQVIDPIYSHASYFGKSIGLNKRTVPINRTVSSKWHQRVITMFYKLCEGLLCHIVYTVHTNWRVFDKKHNYEKKKWRNGLLSICGLSA
jgi:hypothetical protein